MYCWNCGARLRRRLGACRCCRASAEGSALLRARLPLHRRFRRHAIITLALAGLLAVGWAGVRHLRPMDLSTVPVPDVVSMTRSEAEAAIRRAGLRPEPKLMESARDVLWDRVLRQSPPPGGMAARGQKVRLLLVVHQGGAHAPGTEPMIGFQDTLPADAEAPPETAPAALAPGSAAPPKSVPLSLGVPRVVGRSEGAARRMLREVGLGMKVVGRSYRDSVPRGCVIRQAPRPGQAPPADENVCVVISRGPRPASPPAAFVTIYAEPADCAVWVYADGGPTVGKCPCTVRLSPGDHSVLLWDTTHLRQVEFTLRAKAGAGFSVRQRVH